ncbi:DOMON-like domain-containing protein [Croceicoccus ponticola]|uniref:DOMON-like domain-containing protein n=1 Tax=Croceicoccus ponticola TaxID=2217664 RepID=A0A437H0Q9_9SPHN|nr:DOMON-like domain-containing protein [Croceicoccus ponticola]RVQ69092.1 DOMON-like domain-containing protein [Croceicoccus ponticola]
MVPLIPHPSHPPLAVRAVEAEVIFPKPGLAMARYRIDGIAELVVPEFSGRGRQDELWQTTCFELFAKNDDGTYREFNFATSGRWAIYDFDGYRAGMRDFDPTAIPEIVAQSGDRLLTVNVTLSAQDLAGFTMAGFSVVLEEQGGQKSFWALAHTGEKPDFHNAACFTARLEAPAPP